MASPSDCSITVAPILLLMPGSRHRNTGSLPSAIRVSPSCFHSDAVKQARVLQSPWSATPVPTWAPVLLSSLLTSYNGSMANVRHWSLTLPIQIRILRHREVILAAPQSSGCHKRDLHDLCNSPHCGLKNPPVQCGFGMHNAWVVRIALYFFNGRSESCFKSF